MAIKAGQLLGLLAPEAIDLCILIPINQLYKVYDKYSQSLHIRIQEKRPSCLPGVPFVLILDSVVVVGAAVDDVVKKAV